MLDAHHVAPLTRSVQVMSRLTSLAVFAATVAGCADDPTPTASGSGDASTGESSGSVSDAVSTGGPSESATTVNPTSGAATTSSTTDPADSTGDDSGSGSETTSGSTGIPRACPDGLELVALGSTCVSAPIIVEAQPAYDVLAFEGAVVSHDTGVTQYRSVDGQLSPVATLSFPSRGQDLLRALFVSKGAKKGERDERTRVLVTLPDADALAVLTADDDGLLSSSTLLDTGARPMGVSFVLLATGFGYATANIDDGTVSLFSEVGHAALAPAATLDVGGRPRDIASIDQYIGVVDTDASTLTVLTLTEDLEIGQRDTYPVPDTPMSVLGMWTSDSGPPGFLVASRDANRVTLVRADDGTQWAHADYLGGPSSVHLTHGGFWPDDALGNLFFLGAVAMTDTSRIALGVHGSGRGSLSLDSILGEFPTAEGPVALALADANGDGRRDFVTVSPTSGVAIVLQQ